MMSFLPNSIFMRGIYNNYRLLELEDGSKHFISENDFLYNHFPEQSIEEKELSIILLKLPYGQHMIRKVELR